MFSLELLFLVELRQHRHRCLQTITVGAVLAVVQIQQRTSIGCTCETIRIRKEQEKLENQRMPILRCNTQLLVKAVKQM